MESMLKMSIANESTGGVAPGRHGRLHVLLATAFLAVLAPGLGAAAETPVGDKGFVKLFGDENDHFGQAVAIDGETAVAGYYFAYSVEVFERIGEDWLNTATLRADPPSPIGQALALQGDRLVIGSEVSYGGPVAVFDRGPDGLWHQTQLLRGSGAGDESHFGRSVALDRDFVAIGAPGEYDGSPPFPRGQAYVFERQESGEWTEVARLRAPGGHKNDHFGSGVAVAGDLLVVGASALEVAPDRTGAAFVYLRSPEGSWDLVSELLPAVESGFGVNVTVDADGRIVVG